MDEHLQILEQEYCPPLDSALVSAICSDYPQTQDGIAQARALLDSLKQSAHVEQTTDFDPSGSSGYAPEVASDKEKRGSEYEDSNAETLTSQTTPTDYTTLSNDLRALSVGQISSPDSEESADSGFFKDTERYDTPTKEGLLAELFPTLRRDLVAYTLKKCNNDYGKATDELLNRVYFEDTQGSPTGEVVVAKGIDAFSEQYHVPQRGKKGKAKRKQQQQQRRHSSFTTASTPLDPEPDLLGSPTTNKWTHGNRHVEFITSRTHLSTKTVASLYHKNSASLSATILAVVDRDAEENRKKGEPDTEQVQSALDLVAEYPSIDLEHALALIRLTAPSIAKAQDLAKALITQPGTFTPVSRTSTRILPRYAPVQLSDPTTSQTTTTKLPDLAPSARPRDTAALLAGRQQAFDSASAAYRKGGSTPLMKAAAGYYSQLGRDLNANLKASNEADADALVASQSTSSMLDLHGVSVASATRIAKQRTQAWWDALGEQRVPGGGRRGVDGGYRIVTGLGRHSEGGRGRIGPAVVKALVAEGWKVEVGSGELVVWGLVRRR